MDAAISGQGGHDRTLEAARVLVHDFALPPDTAFQLLLSEYNPRCQPAWSEKELRYKVNEAVKLGGDNPRGHLAEQKQDNRKNTGQVGEVGKPESKADETRRAVITPFSEIQERETEWLWHNKIPAGELCLLSGLAGQGKTFWTCYLAAVVSNGWNWPDGTPCPKGNVLYFRGEDSIEKTMKPRLSANGADMLNVILLDRASDDTVLTLHHVDVIRDAMRQSQDRNGLPVCMIIIDPMADYLGDTKENSNCEVPGVITGNPNQSIVLLQRRPKQELPQPFSPGVLDAGRKGTSCEQQKQTVLF